MNAKRRMGLIEIHSDSVEKWRAWARALMNERHAEALDTLAEEGLVCEAFFVLELDGKTYIAFYAEGDGLPANLEREINQKHRSLLIESTIRRIDASELYFLKRTD